MNKKIKNILLFLLFVPSILVCQNISLKEAVDLTIEKNNKISQYREKLIQKEFSEQESLGNFLPTIDLKTSYTHLNENMEINLNPIRDAMIAIQSGNQAELANISNILSGTGPLSPGQKLQIKNGSADLLNNLLPEFKQTFKKQDYLTATLTGIQPIFTGGKLIAAKKYAAAEKEAAEIELKRIQNESITETINNYLRAALIKDVVKLRENALNGIKQHRERAKKLFDEGVIANYHLLRADVALAEAERNLSDDRNNYSLALLALKNSIGLEGNDNIEISDSIHFASYEDNLESNIKNALNNQPALQYISKKKISAEQNSNVARSAFLPTIAAFGKYEMYPEYLSSLEPRWAVGLQMNLSLFNGFKDHIKVQQAKHLENELMFVEADVKKKIELWVNKAFIGIDKSRTKFEKLQSLLALAEENVKQNEKRFETGMGISLEVIDAHLTLEKTELDRSISLYEYFTSLADLYNACGSPESFLNIWNKQE